MQVINGHYRCNLAGYDLNRHWHDPIQDRHPTIYYAKELLSALCEEREVYMFCDIHGHSVKHNLFMYGCGDKSKKRSDEPDNHEPGMSSNACKVFPYHMSTISELLRTATI